MNSNGQHYTEQRYVWKVEFLAHINSLLELSKGEIHVIESSAIRALNHAVVDILLPEHGSYLQVLKIERIADVKE